MNLHRIKVLYHVHKKREKVCKGMYLKRFLCEYLRKDLTKIIGISILCVAKDLACVIALAYATNQVAYNGDIYRALLYMTVVMFTGVAVSGGERVVRGKIALELRKKIMIRFEEKIEKIKLREIEDIDRGKLMNVYVEDISRMINWVDFTVPSTIQTLLYVFGAFIYCYSQSKVLTITVMPAVILFMPVLLKVIDRLSGMIKRERNNVDLLIKKVTEVFRGGEFIKSFSIENKVEDNINKLLLEKKNDDYAVYLLKAVLSAFSFCISYIPGILAALFGGMFLLDGKIKIGFLVGFIQIVNGRVAYVFPQLATKLSSTKEITIILERIYDFFNKEEINRKCEKNSDEGDMDIIFSNVSFTYPGREKILKNVSFKIADKSKVAIVGRSGSGKSTILKLICGYYNDWYTGSITISGKELREWNIDELRKKLALINQDSFLFSGTVNSNLEMIIQDEHEFVKRRKILNVCTKLGFSNETLHKKIEDNGIKLSGGESQRVSIARGLLRNAHIYLFDEPLASLDGETERKIMDLLDKHIGNRTCILVEHRLTALTQFDQIIVLEDGEVKEIGTHTELMSKEGVYYNMYNKMEICYEENK